ncbi:MAG: hypothetical protein ABSE97_01005 [Verrucomicrobiota bacterium]|jgi:hypothetical protein
MKNFRHEFHELTRIHVAERRWKLVSYEVAGIAPNKITRPERTVETQSGGGPPHSKTQAFVGESRDSVLECASPLALWDER